MNQTELTTLRAQIDHLDTQIHDLLMARFEVTARVAAAKGAQTDPSLIPRPARERVIVERLRGRNQGALPLRSLTRIWKELMGAACTQQGEFRIGVVAEPFSALAQGAREHFGTAVPLEFGKESHLVARLRARGLALLVLELPHAVPSGLFAVGDLRHDGEILGRLVSIHNLEV